MTGIDNRQQMWELLPWIFLRHQQHYQMTGNCRRQIFRDIWGLHPHPPWTAAKHSNMPQIVIYTISYLCQLCHFLFQRCAIAPLMVQKRRTCTSRSDVIFGCWTHCRHIRASVELNYSIRRGGIVVNGRGYTMGWSYAVHRGQKHVEQPLYDNRKPVGKYARTEQK